MPSKSIQLPRNLPLLLVGRNVLMPGSSKRITGTRYLKRVMFAKYVAIARPRAILDQTFVVGAASSFHSQADT